MSNYKIRVANKGDIKEAQELFFELGYEKGVCSTGGYPALIIATPESRFQKTPYSSRATSLNHEAHSQYKEITLPELRDMVVLKRNKVGDATHTDGRYSFYVGKDKNYFFSSCDKAWRGTWKNVEILKPIEKPMKEYLRKNSDGTYSYIGTVQPDHVSNFMIEIPEGSETFNYYDGKDNLFFLKGSGEDTMFSNDLNDWDWKHWGDIDFDGVVCLWSRHTHPEELPFVDDEPSQSLNDQYAEIEKVRQSAWQKQEGGSHDEISNPKHYTSGSIECIDAIEASMSHDAFCGFLKGNVQKYLWRYQYKGGLSSLNKAKWYIEKLIETEKCSKVQSLEG